MERDAPDDEMPPFEQLGCSVCREGAGLGFDFTMAFQPIIDAERRQVFAHEALVRGIDGSGAGSVMERVHAGNRYRFDQACRVKAIELAARLGLRTQLNINFLPNAVYTPATCIQVTLEAANRFGFPIERICFEVVESEKIEDQAHLRGIIEEYKRRGFTTAIDDFGAGYAGLNLLADFQPDLIKLDMALTRNIHADQPRQVILKAIMEAAASLGSRVIAEGVETDDEYACLRDAGVALFQGYLFARPALEAITPVADIYFPE